MVLVLGEPASLRGAEARTDDTAVVQLPFRGMCADQEGADRVPVDAGAR